MLEILGEQDAGNHGRGKLFANHKREGELERANGSVGGKDPHGENPMGGTGMKYGQELLGGLKP